MKLIGYEDMIAGILLGVVMIGASKKFFTLPYNNKLLIGFLFLFLILSILDILHELKTFERDFFFTIFAVIWNIAEILIVVVYLFQLFKLPFEITVLTPFISSVGMFGMGIFFILVNIMWLYFYMSPSR